MVLHATTIAHSRHLVDRFVGAGVAAAHVDGDTPTEERSRILRDARRLRILILSSCMVFSEGLDLPRVRGAIMARPTRSLTLFLQQANRAMHGASGQRPIILDHARNVLYHGVPHADRTFSLEEGHKEPGGRHRKPPLKVCDNCTAVLPIGTSICPECETTFPKTATSIPGETDEVLRELTAAEARKLKAKLVAFAKQKRWPMRWVEDLMRKWWQERGLQPA